MAPNPWITAVIVMVTFAGIAVGRYPIIKSNRTTISLMGVAALILFGQIQFDDIPGYLDFNTLILLFSMMIINANLKLAGFFSYAGQALVKYAKTPRVLLAVEVALAGILSALFLGARHKTGENGAALGEKNRRAPRDFAGCPSPRTSI